MSASPEPKADDSTDANAPAHHPRPHPLAAVAFLYWRTFFNRLRAQAARARSPRYIIAVIIGALYIYWALIRNTQMHGGPFRAIVGNEILVPIMSVLLLLAAARWWLFGSDRSAIAFTPAEVQFLFPAPVSRRGLVHAKLVRTQLAILLNTIIWVVLLRGDAATSMGWRRGIALWLLFSTLALHRLGATIVRVNALEHERAGIRRSAIPAGVFLALIGAVAFGLFSKMRDLRIASMSGMKSLFTAIAGALHDRVPSVALWPVRSLIEPVMTDETAVWMSLIPWALLVFALHYVWVVRLDRAFEEAALEATQHRAERLQRFRSSQLGKTRSRKGKLARVPRLRLRGRPEVAIAWKNIAAAIRGGAWRTQVLSFTIGLAVMAVVTRSASARAGEVFLGITVGWGAMLLFVGPLWMRFDLRIDLQRLEILKSLPLSGARIVLAEIVGVTILHSITVWSLMAVPLAMVLQDPELALQSKADIPIFLAVALAVPALNAIMFTVQNGVALLFPAWVRLGAESRGFETMGQNLLTMGATTIVAALGLVFPVGLGIIVAWFGRTWLGTGALLLAVVLGIAIIALQLWPVVLWLGRVFERTDVADVATNG